MKTPNELGLNSSHTSKLSHHCKLQHTYLRELRWGKGNDPSQHCSQPHLHFAMGVGQVCHHDVGTPLTTGIPLCSPFPQNGWFGWPTYLQAVFHLGMTTIFPSKGHETLLPCGTTRQMRSCCNSGKSDGAVKNSSGNGEFGGSWEGAFLGPTYCKVCGTAQ